MPAGHTAGTFSYRNNIKHLRRLSKLEQTRRSLERAEAAGEDPKESKEAQDPEDPVLQSYLAYVKDRRTAAKKELEDLELQEAYETYLLKAEQEKSRRTSVNGEKRSTRQSRAHALKLQEIREKRQALAERDPDFFYAVNEKKIRDALHAERSGKLVDVPYLVRAKEQVFASLDAGIPVYLVGHLGSGKTQLAIECAEEYMARRLLQKELTDRMKEYQGDDPYAFFCSIYPEVRDKVNQQELHPYFIAGSHNLTAEDMFFEKTLKLSHASGRDSDKEQLQTLIEGFVSFARENEAIMKDMTKDQQLELLLAGWKTFSNLYIAENSGYGTTVEKIEKEVLLALREGKPVIIDEINTIAMANLIALNDILQHHAGQTAYVTGIGSITIAEGFCLIGTGNLSTGTVSYEGTNVLNPAFQSRFTTIVYNYVPQEETGDLGRSEHPERNELFHLLLLHLADRDGTLSLPEPEQSLPALWHLAQMARVSEDIFEGRGSVDTKDGDVPVLNEAVLSVRGLIHVLDHWNFGEEEDLTMALWNGFLSSVTNADDRNLLLSLAVRYGFFTETGGWHVESRKRGSAPLSFDEIRTIAYRHHLLPLETLSTEDLVHLLFGEGPKRTEIQKDLGDTILFDDGTQKDLDQAQSLDEGIRELEQSADILSAAVTDDAKG